MGHKELMQELMIKQTQGAEVNIRLSKGRKDHLCGNEASSRGRRRSYLSNWSYSARIPHQRMTFKMLKSWEFYTPTRSPQGCAIAVPAVKELCSNVNTYDAS